MFNKLSYPIAFVIFTFMFSGCATQTHLPMTKDAQNNIQSTDVVIGLAQEEIFAEIEQSNVTAATGGGLLFALIDSSINSSRTEDAEELVKPVKNSLIDYDFPSEFETALKAELQRLSWLNTVNYQTEKPYSIKTDENILTKSSADIVLVLNTSYRFSPGLKSIKVSSAIKGYANSEELKTIAEKSNPNSQKPILYMNNFVYSQPIQGMYTDSEQAAKGWSSNEAQQVKTALAQGVEELAKMIATDLDIARAQYKDKSVQASQGEQVTYDGITGTVVSENGNRVVLRLANGSLYSTAHGK